LGTIWRIPDLSLIQSEATALCGQSAEAGADNYDLGQRRALAAATIVSMPSNIPSMLGIASHDQSRVTC
jgi:hypothetical protein